MKKINTAISIASIASIVVLGTNTFIQSLTANAVTTNGDTSTDDISTPTKK